MSGDLHQISVEIGHLKSDVKGLTKLVSETREESRSEHRKVHDIIDALSESVRGLADHVKEMKPLTDDYREKRAEARGRQGLLQALWALGGGTVAMLGSKAWDLWLSIRPHP